MEDAFDRCLASLEKIGMLINVQQKRYYPLADDYVFSEVWSAQEFEDPIGIQSEVFEDSIGIQSDGVEQIDEIDELRMKLEAELMNVQEEEREDSIAQGDSLMQTSNNGLSASEERGGDYPLNNSGEEDQTPFSGDRYPFLDGPFPGKVDSSPLDKYEIQSETRVKLELKLPPYYAYESKFYNIEVLNVQVCSNECESLDVLVSDGDSVGSSEHAVCFDPGICEVFCKDTCCVNDRVDEFKHPIYDEELTPVRGGVHSFGYNNDFGFESDEENRCKLLIDQYLNSKSIEVENIDSTCVENDIDEVPDKGLSSELLGNSFDCFEDWNGMENLNWIKGDSEEVVVLNGTTNMYEFVNASLGVEPIRCYNPGIAVMHVGKLVDNCSEEYGVSAGLIRCFDVSIGFLRGNDADRMRKLHSEADVLGSEHFKNQVLPLVNHEQVSTSDMHSFEGLEEIKDHVYDEDFRPKNDDIAVVMIRNDGTWEKLLMAYSLRSNGDKFAETSSQVECVVWIAQTSEFVELIWCYDPDICVCKLLNSSSESYSEVTEDGVSKLKLQKFHTYAVVFHKWFQGVTNPCSKNLHKFQEIICGDKLSLAPNIDHLETILGHIKGWRIILQIIVWSKKSKKLCCCFWRKQVGYCAYKIKESILMMLGHCCCKFEVCKIFWHFMVKINREGIFGVQLERLMRLEGLFFSKSTAGNKLQAHYLNPYTSGEDTIKGSECPWISDDKFQRSGQFELKSWLTWNASSVIYDSKVRMKRLSTHGFGEGLCGVILISHQNDQSMAWLIAWKGSEVEYFSGSLISGNNHGVFYGNNLEISSVPVIWSAVFMAKDHLSAHLVCNEVLSNRISDPKERENSKLWHFWCSNGQKWCATMNFEAAWHLWCSNGQKWYATLDGQNRCIFVNNDLLFKMLRLRFKNDATDSVFLLIFSELEDKLKDDREEISEQHESGFHVMLLVYKNKKSEYARSIWFLCIQQLMFWENKVAQVLKGKVLRLVNDDAQEVPNEFFAVQLKFEDAAESLITVISRQGHELQTRERAVLLLKFKGIIGWQKFLVSVFVVSDQYSTSLEFQIVILHSCEPGFSRLGMKHAASPSEDANDSSELIRQVGQIIHWLIAWQRMGVTTLIIQLIFLEKNAAEHMKKLEGQPFRAHIRTPRSNQEQEGGIHMFFYGSNTIHYKRNSQVPGLRWSSEFQAELLVFLRNLQNKVWITAWKCFCTIPKVCSLRTSWSLRGKDCHELEIAQRAKWSFLLDKITQLSSFSWTVSSRQQ